MREILIINTHMKVEWQHDIFISYILILWNVIRSNEMYLCTLPPDINQALMLTL